jgi:hypothetical protein
VALAGAAPGAGAAKGFSTLAVHGFSRQRFGKVDQS